MSESVEVSAGKRRLQARAVQEGAEEALHHLLESAVMQANVDLHSDGEAPEPQHDDPRGEADERRTRAFRAFAERDQRARERAVDDDRSS
ncbi:MAG: hypothetical protein ACYCU0_08600 [Solirubrobacteraceae bacterium]